MLVGAMTVIVSRCCLLGHARDRIDRRWRRLLGERARPHPREKVLGTNAGVGKHDLRCGAESDAVELGLCARDHRFKLSEVR